MRGLLVGNRALPVFKEQALGSRRAERASPEKADCSEQANQAPSQEVSAWCARCVFLLYTRGIRESEVYKDHPRFLVVLHNKGLNSKLMIDFEPGGYVSTCVRVKARVGVRANKKLAADPI